MEHETVKIGQITEKDFNQLRKLKDKRKKLLSFCGLPATADYEIGDSAVTIPEPELYGIYRTIWKGRTHYYLAVSIMGENLAFAWTLYPVVRLEGE